MERYDGGQDNITVTLTAVPIVEHEGATHTPGAILDSIVENWTYSSNTQHYILSMVEKLWTYQLHQRCGIVVTGDRPHYTKLHYMRLG